MPVTSLNVAAGFMLLTGCIASATYFMQLVRATRQIPRIQRVSYSEQKAFMQSCRARMTVIIPAFNEADNIEACVRSVLEGNPLPLDRLQVRVIDDQSTDRTFTILKNLEQELADPRLTIQSGQPRPANQVWTGKNWACEQAAQCADGDYLLFIDADMRLKPGAIATILQTAEATQFDLITCIPEIVCGSLVEWLVQPLIFMNALVAFNSASVRDPNKPTAFALGPFLLFRNAAYRQIGGHAAVAAAVAEDVALARRIKGSGRKFRHFLGSDLAALRMYRNWPSLWEGWTKVLYVGANCNPWLMLLLALTMLTVNTLPWVLLPWLLWQGFTGASIAFVEVGFTALLILLQYSTRAVGSAAMGISTRYWWLQGIGGMLVALLGLASWIKTETGWGWTWKGRSLTLVRHPEGGAGKDAP